jgi:hypothetical protein
VVSKLWAVDYRGLDLFQGTYEITGRAQRIYVSSQRIWLFLAALLCSDILWCYYSDKYNAS